MDAIRSVDLNNKESKNKHFLMLEFLLNILYNMPPFLVS